MARKTIMGCLKELAESEDIKKAWDILIPSNKEYYAKQFKKVIEQCFYVHYNPNRWSLTAKGSCKITLVNRRKLANFFYFTKVIKVYNYQ